MKHGITIVSKLSMAICAVFLLAAFVAGGPAGPNYQFYTIDEAGPPAWIFVIGINNSRLATIVYGDAEGNAYTHLWSNGQETPVVYPGSSTSTLMGDVNNRGLVFGNVGGVNVQHAAVLNLATGIWTLLPDIPGQPVNIGNRMNEHGIGVGTACLVNIMNGTNCIPWTWDGKTYSFQDIPGTSNEWEGPIGINDRGEEVGAFEDGSGTLHAYLLTQSEFTQIDIPGATFTQAFDINNSGEILLTGDGGSNIGIWRKGVFTPLPTVPGASLTVAYALNDHGDYSGQYTDADGVQHGFVALRK